MGEARIATKAYRRRIAFVMIGFEPGLIIEGRGWQRTHPTVGQIDGRAREAERQGDCLERPVEWRVVAGPIEGGVDGHRCGAFASAQKVQP